MERPELNLENEIVNFFSHTVEVTSENKDQTLKRIPGLVKSAIKSLATLESAKGKLGALEQNSPEHPDIPGLKEYIETTEVGLKRYYYREEIKGT